MQTEQYMESLQSCLLEYKEQIQTIEEGADGQQLLSHVIRKFNMDYINKKKAELIGREMDKKYRRVLETLGNFRQTLRMENICQRESAFLRIKELFEQENECFENQQSEAAQVLENVFDFLEGAFGNSQEMVMFLTELNSNSYSVSFLQENECQRYYYYNKELLFDEKRKNLLKRMS